MATKVYGMLVHAPLRWPIEPSANGGRQVRVIAAVPSMAEFQRLLDKHDLRVSLHVCRQYASVTGNPHEIKVATGETGVLFRAVTTANRPRDGYVLAEVKAPPGEPTLDQSYCDVGRHLQCSGYTEDESDPETCMCRCHDNIDGVSL